MERFPYTYLLSVALNGSLALPASLSMDLNPVANHLLDYKGTDVLSKGPLTTAPKGRVGHYCLCRFAGGFRTLLDGGTKTGDSVRVIAPY